MPRQRKTLELRLRERAVVATFVCGLGYLYAVIPSQIVDPLLKHHVRFPSRINQFDWWVTGLAFVLVLLATFPIARKATNASIFFIPMPLAVAAFATNYFVFPQELPHLQVSFIVACWFCLTVVWMWITHTSESTLEKLEDISVDQPEFVKEQVLFYRTLAFGLVASFLAILVSGASSIHSMNAATVGGDLTEANILFQLNGTTILVLGCFALLGPIYKALQAWRLISQKLITRPPYLIKLLPEPHVKAPGIDEISLREPLNKHSKARF